MKRLFFFLVVVALAFAAAAPALADGIITVNGRPLSLTPQTVDFGSLQLTGKSEIQPGTTTAWVSVDPTGTGDGFRLVIKADDFKRNDDPAKIIPIEGLTMTLTDEAISPRASVVSPKPASDGVSGIVMDKTAFQRFAHADLNTGMGEYNLVPTFDLVVPAETYAGSYTAVIYTDILAGPTMP